MRILDIDMRLGREASYMLYLHSAYLFDAYIGTCENERERESQGCLQKHSPQISR
jgi:hypothetical protein